MWEWRGRRGRCLWCPSYLFKARGTVIDSKPKSTLIWKRLFDSLFSVFQENKEESTLPEGVWGWWCWKWWEGHCYEGGPKSLYRYSTLPYASTQTSFSGGIYLQPLRSRSTGRDIIADKPSRFMPINISVLSWTLMETILICCLIWLWWWQLEKGRIELVENSSTGSDWGANHGHQGAWLSRCTAIKVHGRDEKRCIISDAPVII